jgi:hypothetical protein
MRILLFLLFLLATMLPVRAAEKITVEQLDHTLADAHGKRDQDLSKQLGGMQLSERLNSRRLAIMQADLPGKRSRLALLALADASAFLQLPAAEVPAIAPPDADTQRLILSRAAEELVTSIKKLPDFFGRKTTTRFHDLKVSYEKDEPIIREHQPFRLFDTFTSAVYYRDGKEVEETDEKHPKIKLRPANGMSNWGVFGPLLRIALTDISKGKIEWSHWEQRAAGPSAVFQYAIPKEESSYTVRYLTGLGFFEAKPAFHGEIAIDPGTGAVYRLVLITELMPTDPIIQAQTLVEYEPVEIGGKVYICPRKSVSITTSISETVRRNCWQVDDVNRECGPNVSYKPMDTAINDTVYDSYHMFRSEIKILPAENMDQQDGVSPRVLLPRSAATGHDL